MNSQFADLYIEELLTLSDVASEYLYLSNKFINEITKTLQFALQREELSQTNLLLAYCLYFWESFTAGYAFELQIYRDLSAAGIVFDAHNIRDHKGRRSHSDLKVLGLSGDIKTSLYFLKVGRSRNLPHDFYITRIYDKEGRQRILVAMLKPEAWSLINGVTVKRLLSEVIQAFPSPVRVDLNVGTVVITDYEVWKTKVLSCQEEWEHV